MSDDPVDLACLVDSLSESQIRELEDAIGARRCREKYGADRIDELLEVWEHVPPCPTCRCREPFKDGSTPQGRARWRCPSCGARFSALTGTIFASAKLPLYKIIRIVEVMCHNASLRLIELTCGVSHPTAHLWRHKVFSTIDSWQEKVMLSGRVWIDEMYFNDTDLLHDLGRKPKRGLSKDLICVVVAIDAHKNVLAVVSENGKPSTKRINAALEAHIEPGSTIVHYCEKAHNALVKKLRLVDERYKANTADPDYLLHMALVNNLCSWIRRYVGRFSCMKSVNLQSYLNWFVYLFRVHRDEEKWPTEERVVRHLALSEGTHLRK